MKRNRFCWIRLLLGLALFAAGAGQGGGLGLVVEQVAAVGPRQWLSLVAIALVPAPVVAPVSKRIAGIFARKPAQVAADDAGLGDTA